MGTNAVYHKYKRIVEFSRVVSTRCDVTETNFHVLNERFVRGRRCGRVRNGTVPGRCVLDAANCRSLILPGVNVPPMDICWAWLHVMYFYFMSSTDFGPKNTTVPFESRRPRGRFDDKNLVVDDIFRKRARALGARHATGTHHAPIPALYTVRCRR